MGKLKRESDEAAGRRASAARASPPVNKQPAARRRDDSATRASSITVSANEGTFRVVKEGVRPDERGRVPVGQEILAEEQYRVLVDDEGRILLDPVVTVPTRELWLFRNQDAFISLIRGVRQAHEGDLHDLGSFARFADDEDTAAEGEEAGQPSRGHVAPAR